MKRDLVLDFDGVLHSYASGWKGAHVIPDGPVEGAGLFLLQAVQKFRVSIFSSRSRSLRGRWAMKRWLRRLLWDACLRDTEEAERAWVATSGMPPEWKPWTLYDVRDQADWIMSSIKWPLFKPAAFLTIDDRSLTFTGSWPSMDELLRFQPWNKKPRAP